MLDWLLIDLDNTLLDFNAGANRSLIEAMMAFEIEPSSQHIHTYHEINHQCWEAFEKGEFDISTLRRKRFELFVEVLDVDVNADRINAFYLDRLSQQTDEIAGARTFLDWAHSRYRLVLATNGFASVQWPRIRKAQLLPYFEHILISEEIGVQKPAGGFFDHAFHRMEFPEKDRVMIIGDSLSSDIEGGRSYGIRTCWLRHESACGSDSEDNMHFEVSSLSEIPALLAT